MIIVYKFSAEWDESCKLYDPIFNKVSEKFNNSEIEFKKIDVEDFPELTNKYNIKFVPMTLIEVSDEIKFKRVGILSENELENEINKNIGL
jgi:thioredoxin 1